MMPTATTLTMPIAMESRNDVFITVQASTWVSRSRARRGLRGRPSAARPRRPRRACAGRGRRRRVVRSRRRRRRGRAGALAGRAVWSRHRLGRRWPPRVALPGGQQPSPRGVALLGCVDVSRRRGRPPVLAVGAVRASGGARSLSVITAPQRRLGSSVHRRRVDRSAPDCRPPSSHRRAPAPSHRPARSSGARSTLRATTATESPVLGPTNFTPIVERPVGRNAVVDRAAHDLAVGR